MVENHNNGPSGGTGGTPFVDDVVDDYVRLKEIRIRSGNLIDAIQTVYEKANGDTDEKPKRGGIGGNLNVFTLDDDKFVTGIRGRFGIAVDSLIIVTNKQTSAQFGGVGGGSDYAYNAPDGTEIAGFLGRFGNVIDAIGVVLRKRS